MKGRRKFTEDEKNSILERWRAGEKPAALQKEFKISSSMLYTWKNKAKFGKPKKAEKSQIGGGNVKDAIIYLRHAREDVNKDLRAGRIKRYSKAQLLMLLALQVLTGE